MKRNRVVHVIEDTRFRDHRSPVGHPEKPERLDALAQAIEIFGQQIRRLTPQTIDSEALLRVHDRALLQVIETSCAEGISRLDADTFLCPESLEVARLAAGSVRDLVLRVARGELEAGLAAVRPPGHHAEAGRAMGFCLFNNVAIAARALQAEAGLEKILILDWDVHHGNGTQNSFYDDPSILYLSTHQFPHYPGTGAFDETGAGRGEGSTVNVPLPAGCGDEDFLGLLGRILVPVARGFQPDMILVSCGFDAHQDDPLAGMLLTGRGYYEMTQLVRALADEVCEGRLAFALEGGYAPTGI
ncbi:MAG: histone deacetylase, partial [Myxococcota bacterium]|nr:histone deacetylase [Myxococcota bacterium]